MARHPQGIANVMFVYVLRHKHVTQHKSKARYASSSLSAPHLSSATWPPRVGFSWGYNYVVSAVFLTVPPLRKQQNTNQDFPPSSQYYSRAAVPPSLKSFPSSQTVSFYSLFLERPNLRWASLWFNDVFLMTAGVICICANRALLQCSGWFNDVGCRNKFIFW